jgi:hypothetical protein
VDNRYIRSLFFVAAIGAAGYGVYALVPKPALPAQNVSPVSNRSPNRRNLPAGPASRSSRPVLAHYQQAIQDNLFTAPLPKTQWKSPVTSPPGLSASLAPVPPIPPADPLSDAVYSGSFTVNGQTTALIERRSTREGTYVEEGKEWQGLPIVEISPSEVAFSINGTLRRLPKSEAFNTLPLTADAPGSENKTAGPSPNGGNSQNVSMALQQEMVTKESGIAVDYMRVREEQKARVLELQSAQDAMSIQGKL